MSLFIAIVLFFTLLSLSSARFTSVSEVPILNEGSVVRDGIKFSASTLIGLIAIQVAGLSKKASPRVFTFVIFFATTILSPVLACTNVVLPTPTNYTGLCGCTAPQLPLRSAYGACQVTYRCMNPGDNVTDNSCGGQGAVGWRMVDDPLAFTYGWADINYLNCLDCPTTTTTLAAATLLSTTTLAAATSTAAEASTSAATTSVALSTTTSVATATSTTAAATSLRASTTTAAATTSQALSTSTVSAVTSTYSLATSLGAAGAVAATSSVSTTAPSESLSPTPVHIEGFVSVIGPWTATAITIFTAVNTSTSGLARLTVDGPVIIQHGASAIIELSGDIVEPKRLRLILATSISGDFDSVTIQPKAKKSGCSHTKYHVKSVAMATMLAVDVSSETEKSCPTNRAWLIGVIVFASVFAVGVIFTFIGVSMEKWKPEWSYLSRKRATSASYYDANAY